ncbi:hypothetical protein [Metallibacterium scheffleri]
MDHNRRKDLESLADDAPAILASCKLAQPWLKRPGDIFQCKTTAYRPGRYYVMGFNPGGKGDAGVCLQSTLEQLPAINDKKAKHPLSGTRVYGNLKKLACMLRAHDPQEPDTWEDDLFITNLFPDASMGVRAWKQQNSHRPARDYVSAVWPLHQQMLSVVRPSYVIAFGQGSRDSTFRYLWDHLKDEDSHKTWDQTMNPKTKALDPTIKSFTVSELPVLSGTLKNVTFIGIRHLSYHAPSDTLRCLL